ncbi:MAG: hypothetical protein RJQ00_05800 [Vicingaceae bacterium]
MKKASLIALIAFYFFAGLNHFLVSNLYLPLIPEYLPYPNLLNYLSGALEIGLAIGLFFLRSRKIAVYGIIFLLILFIPAHLFFIEQGNCFNASFCLPAWVSWLRLLLIHPLLIYWAYSHRNNTHPILIKWI